MKRQDGGPLLVYGPRSPTYDFGPQHPLTPRRFGPGIDLLQSLGAEPGLAPEPAADKELLLCHTRRYVEVVRRFSVDPFGPGEAGIGEGGDNPAFRGMHAAAASVAGGSLRAMEAILGGDVEHAFHPGGGLHHALADRASGFCIYDDPALAIARARRDGLRVLYLDFDVHHGDGVQALFIDDPGVLTISFHESGRYLFPGTGFAHELGEGAAAGTSVNVPLEPFAGEGAWLPAVASVVPPLAAAFGPDLIVSQHGADSHAWDPLAHLRVTTTAMGAAARIVDRLSHLHAGGRWLSTGGGGYDAYRVVPRDWAHVWLAAAHREAPAETPEAWRARWAAEGARYGQAPLPATFDDPPNAGEPRDATQDAAEEQSLAMAGAVRESVVPALLRTAEARGWWSPFDGPAGEGSATTPTATPHVVGPLTPDELGRLRLAERVIPPAAAGSGLHILRAAAVSGATVVAAVADDVIVGAGVVSDGVVLALGVAPAHRRSGLGRALLARLVETARGPLEATVGVGERDPVDPLPEPVRAVIARDMLESAGFTVASVGRSVGRIDRSAVVGRKGPS